MKTILLILVAAMMITGAAAQTDSAFAYADYSFRHLDDTTQPHFPRTEQTRLYLGRKLTCYVNHRSLVALLRMIDNPQMNAEAVADARRSLVTGAIFKNLENPLLTWVAPAGLNTYLIEEPMPGIKWNVTQETMDIKGYTCQKATCSFRGRDYEAWFCPQLPYSNGPWKFGGLPGLILEVYDTKKDVEFRFEGFGTGSDIPTFSIPTWFAKTTNKAYAQYIDAMNKDNAAMLGASSGGRGVYQGMSSSSAKGGPPKRIKILNNPIEKTNP